MISDFTRSLTYKLARDLSVHRLGPDTAPDENDFIMDGSDYVVDGSDFIKDEEVGT